MPPERLITNLRAIQYQNRLLLQSDSGYNDVTNAILRARLGYPPIRSKIPYCPKELSSCQRQDLHVY